MTTTTPTPLDRIRWLPYVNAEEDAAPAGACLAITDVTVDNGQAMLECVQFAGDACPVAFNCLQQVAAGSPGQCTQDFPALAAYDASATPATGDTWIPKSGQWSLTKGLAGAANGFIVLGAIDATAQTMWVAPANSTSAAVVAVLDTSGVTAGTPSSPYGQCVWAGQIVTVQASAPTFCNDTGGNRYTPTPLPAAGSGNCWILDLDSLSGSGAPNATLVKGEKYIGAPCGSYAVGSVTLPLYAVRRGQQSDVVQITTTNSVYFGSGSATTGQVVKANASNVFDAQVQSWTPGTSSLASSPYTSGVSAWLAFADAPYGSQGSTTPFAVAGDNYTALLVGSFTVSGVTRPLYICRKGLPAGPAEIIGGTTAGSLSSGGGSCACNVAYYHNGANPGSTVTVTDKAQQFGGSAGYPIASGKACLAYFDRNSGEYYFLWINSC